MTHTTATRPFSPTATALLKSAMLPPAEAVHHWQRWTNEQGFGRFSPTDTDLLPRLFDPLTTDEQRVMPLIYRNLEKSGDRLVPHLRGIYRYTWMTNQRLLHRLTTVVTALDAVGIPTLILKGMPLSLHYYGDAGVRFMNDADLLVPADRYDEAIALLQTAPFGLRAGWLDHRFRKHHHALNLHDADKGNLDLHQHVLYAQLHPTASDSFWKNSVPITLPGGVMTRRLSDTDQLLHLLYHGYVGEITPILRWVHDCHAVYTHTDSQIDWHRLLDQSQARRLNHAVRQNLLQLRQEWGLDLPGDIMQRLDNLAIEPKERAYFELVKTPRPGQFLPWGWQLWQTAQAYYGLFLRKQSGISRTSFTIGRMVTHLSHWLHR